MMRKASATRAAVAPRTALNLPTLADMLGLPLPAPEPEVVEPTRPTMDLDSEPVKSSLRVRLLGTLLSGVKEWSFASIQDVVTQKAGTFMVGMEVQGAPVLDIERNRVIVLNNGRREFINNEAGTGEAVAYTPPAMPRPSDAPPAPSATGSGIKAIDDSHYEVPRAEIDKTLSNLNDVAMQARIVPAFKDGVAQGFKLFSIRPDSIYTKIGIQNGDVIRRINGYDLNSPEKALEIYSKLKEASRIDIEVERNGAVLQKTYNVR
jgi:general secretion pathway protein C